MVSPCTLKMTKKVSWVSSVPLWCDGICDISGLFWLLCFTNLKNLLLQGYHFRSMILKSRRLDLFRYDGDDDKNDAAAYYESPQDVKGDLSALYDASCHTVTNYSETTIDFNL